MLTLMVANGLFCVARTFYTRLQAEAAGLLQGVP